jgi:hypothetical protein
MCPFDIFNSAKLKNAIKLALLYVKIVVVDGSVSWSSGRLPPVFFFVFCSVLSVVPTVSLLSVVFRFLAGGGSGSLVWFLAL